MRIQVWAGWMAVWLLVAVSAQAEIVKCVQPDGTVLYTDTACAGSTEVPLELKPLPIVGPGKDEVTTVVKEKGKQIVRQSAKTDAIPRHLSESKFRWPDIPLPNISPLDVSGIYLLMSLLSFGVFWLDKRRAVENEQRVPENILHGLEWLGGWPGSLLAQHTLRHKNRKLSYQGVFWFIVFTHVLLWTDYHLDHALWHWLQAASQELYLQLRRYVG